MSFSRGLTNPPAFRGKDPVAPSDEERRLQRFLSDFAAKGGEVRPAKHPEVGSWTKTRAWPILFDLEGGSGEALTLEVRPKDAARAIEAAMQVALVFGARDAAGAWMSIAPNVDGETAAPVERLALTRRALGTGFRAEIALEAPADLRRLVVGVLVLAPECEVEVRLWTRGRTERLRRFAAALQADDISSWPVRRVRLGRKTESARPIIVELPEARSETLTIEAAPASAEGETPAAAEVAILFGAFDASGALRPLTGVVDDVAAVSVSGGAVAAVRRRLEEGLRLEAVVGTPGEEAKRLWVGLLSLTPGARLRARIARAPDEPEARIRRLKAAVADPTAGLGKTCPLGGTETSSHPIVWEFGAPATTETLLVEIEPVAPDGKGEAVVLFGGRGGDGRLVRVPAVLDGETPAANEAFAGLRRLVDGPLRITLATPRAPRGVERYWVGVTRLESGPMLKVRVRAALAEEKGLDRLERFATAAIRDGEAPMSAKRLVLGRAVAARAWPVTIETPLEREALTLTVAPREKDAGGDGGVQDAEAAETEIAVLASGRDAAGAWRPLAIKLDGAPMESFGGFAFVRRPVGARLTLRLEAFDPPPEVERLWVGLLSLRPGASLLFRAFFEEPLTAAALVSRSGLDRRLDALPEDVRPAVAVLLGAARERLATLDAAEIAVLEEDALREASLSLLRAEGAGAALAVVAMAGTEHDRRRLIEALAKAAVEAENPAAGALGWLLWLLDPTPRQARRAAAVLFKSGDLSNAAALEARGEGPPATLFESNMKIALDLKRAAPEPPKLAPRPARGPRKVAYVASSALNCRLSGYTVRTHELLKALRRAGVEVVCQVKPGYPDNYPRHMPDPPPGRTERIEDIPYLFDRFDKAAATPGVYDRMADVLEARLREEGATIVHAASNHENAFPALIAARRLGLPFVYEVRGLWELTAASRRPGWERTERYALDSALEARIVAEADHVFVITEGVRQELIARGGAPERISLLPNAVDPARFQPKPRDEALLARLGLEGMFPLMVYCGSIEHYEGLDDLAQAVMLLRERGLPAGLLIVGDGAYAEPLRKLLAETGAEEAVRMIGRIPPETVPDHWRLADLAVFPRKPFRVCEIVSPLKPFECMALGKPCVLSDLPALREIGEAGVTGLLCRPADPADLADRIAELAGAPDRLAGYGEAAAAWVRRERTWEANARRVLDVYDALEGRGDLLGRSAMRVRSALRRLLG